MLQSNSGVGREWLGGRMRSHLIELMAREQNDFSHFVEQNFEMGRKIFIILLLANMPEILVPQIMFIK